MKRIFNGFCKNIHWVLYAVFLFLQVFAHRFIVFFGDDYYYANFIPQGWKYFLDETVFHYTKTNGRFFVHLIDEILLGIDMDLWRIFNIAVIALVILFAAKIAAQTYKYGHDTKKFKIALIASVILFGAISPEIYINCIYWATGSVNYLFPSMLVLIYYYYCKKDLEYNKGFKWLPVLAFFASFTTEQSAAAAVAVSIYVILASPVFLSRRPRVTYFISLATSLIAFASVVFAPGNAVRTTYYPEFYALSFFGKLYNGSFVFMEQVFGICGLLLLFVILASYTAVRAFRAAKRARKIKKLALILGGVSVFAFTFAYIVIASLPKNDITVLLTTALALLIVTPYFVLKVIEFFSKKDKDSMFFFVLAAVLQIVMLISPEFGWRTLVVSLVLLFVPALKAVIYMASDLKKRAKICVVIIAALAVSIALHTPISIGLGYMENYPVHQYNAEMMEKYVSGEIKTVKLAYPINDTYRYTMPYEGWYNMMRYMQLYGLPKDMIVEYEKYPG